MNIFMISLSLTLTFKNEYIFLAISEFLQYYILHIIVCGMQEGQLVCRLSLHPYHQKCMIQLLKSNTISVWFRPAVNHFIRYHGAKL